MNSIPAFGSYTVIDSESRTWRVTPNSQPLEKADHVGPVAERDTVDISQAARDRYRTDINHDEVTARAPGFEEAAKRQGARPTPEQLAAASEQLAAGGAGNRHRVVEAGKIHVPVMTPEERVRFETVSDPMTELKARGEVLNKLNPEYLATSDRLEDVYSGFVQTFLDENPDFSDASFGFSVSASGKLVATSTEGLNAGQIFRFERALNESTELVEMSVKLADLNIQIYDAENQIPYFKLDRDTYAQTIDLGVALLSRHAARGAPRDGSATELTQKNWDNNWRQQLVRNGERNSPDAERVFYSAR